MMDDKYVEICFIDNSTEKVVFEDKSDNDHGINLYLNKDKTSNLFVPYNAVKWIKVII